MRLFVGLDALLVKTAVCVLSEHGKILKEAEVATEPEMLVRMDFKFRHTSSSWASPRTRRSSRAR